MDCRDIIQLRKWCFQFINLCRSFTRTLAINSYGTDRRRWTRGLRSRWGPNRSWRRISVQFFIMMRWCIIRWEMRRSRIRRSLLSGGRLLCRLLGRRFPLPRPRPLPVTRRIWWDWSKGMISIYNNAVVDCRDTVEEWWERRLPTSFYTLWIDVMRSPTKR